MGLERTISVHLLPSIIPEGALDGGVAVVVDILRATTVMTHALASGAEAIIPCLEIDEACEVAAGLPDGTALLAGERQGVPIEGFDLGNSPQDFTPERCRGKTIVMTTTNGTRAILASTRANRVLIGAFTNLGAVRNALMDEAKPIHIVCAGTDGFVSWEDSMFAGALVRELVKEATIDQINDAARIASLVWNPSLADCSLTGSAYGIEEALCLGRGGQRVKSLGLHQDIFEVSKIDSIAVLPELRKDPLRIVRGGATGGDSMG